MNEDVPVGRLFYPLPRHGTRCTNERTRIRRSDTSSHSDLNLFMSQTNSTDIKLRARTWRKRLDRFRQKDLRKLAKESSNRLDTCEESVKRWYDIIKDMYLTKLFAKVKVKPKRKPPKYKIPIHFDNKGFEFIRLNSILRHKEVKGKLPE